jgi:hypothetical protein
MPRTHREPYLYLAGLTHDSALIAWGAFYFSVHEGEQGWELVDDEELPSRKESIGERSEPFGDARVRVYDTAGELVAEAATRERNHVLLTGLKPNQRYRYAVVVDGEPWAAGELNDWCQDPESGRELLRPSGRRYDNTFHTHPAPDQPAALDFVLLGDYGVGIRGKADSARRQLEVSVALERAVDQHGARLLLTAGDNIYLRTKLSRFLPRALLGDQGSGDEDDDWFFTFYQPYRYVINRIPVYPTVGNHDSGETEQSDDREQLEDNFFLRTRFSDGISTRSTNAPGLYYRFCFGSDIEFVSIDTSHTPKGSSHEHYFELPAHREFLEQAFRPRDAAEPARLWRIPFAHHPPYCAGPHHGNNEVMLKQLVPLFEAAGVRAMFSGHEHNFQYSLANDVHYFVSGAGAKLRPKAPGECEAARTLAWAAQSHFLLVQIRGTEMRVTPITRADGDRLEPVVLNPTGAAVPVPIVVRA